MKLHDNLRSITVAAAVSAALTLGAVAALAQPMAWPHGPGPHGHGPHGPGAPDQMIGQLIESSKAQLNLNTSQQVMFDAAVASTKSARAFRPRGPPEGQGHADGRAGEERARPRRGRGGRGRRAAAGAGAAEVGPQPVAGALRDVHAGAKGSREGSAAEGDGERRIVPAEDAGPRQDVSRRNGRLTPYAVGASRGVDGPGLVPGPFLVRTAGAPPTSDRASSAASAASLRAVATTGFCSRRIAAASTSACAAPLVSPDTISAGVPAPSCLAQLGDRVDARCAVGQAEIGDDEIRAARGGRHRTPRATRAPTSHRHRRSRMPSTMRTARTSRRPRPDRRRRR